MKYETKEFFFAVKDSEERMTIICEPMTDKLSMLRHSDLLLELNQGIDFEEAQKIAQYLNEVIRGVSVIEYNDNNETNPQQ